MAKISFGLIALNAQPFLEYNLRALYPFAHQIIVVEGATVAAKGLARLDGHSSDGTFEMLQEFKRTRDPQGKLTLVAATDESHAAGFWPEKDEMSRAYAKRATGDWLWQVDSDEFYLDKDMNAVQAILDADQISGISFPFFEFWGGFSYVANGVLYLNELPEVPRVFRWKAGYTYLSHRPPTVADEKGNLLNEKGWLSGTHMRARGIFMRHYSYVLPKQAKQKVGYYSNVTWTDAFRGNDAWYRESYVDLKRPMFLSERGVPFLQWLERFRGQHPSEILALQRDLKDGKVNEELRSTSDIERLLESKVYDAEKFIAKFILALYWPLRTVWKKVRGAIFRNSTQGAG